ncbi:MAG TPA: YigZ family protein [Candidatus Aphodousia gallistercoris]|nr:YigZ family protein [Candidatus Aphodousia gallistercoris]
MSTVYNVPDLAPGQIHRAEETIHRSRFIVTIARVTSPEEAKAFIEEVRTEHAQATHNCWAFVAGSPGSTAHVGASDDGEPKGTAGRPMLTVLLHCGVGEIAAVVTRYFGGILLGTGGLVRAYQGLVKLGLESLPLRERVPSQIVRITLEHRFVNIALRAFEDARAMIRAKDFGMDVTFELDVPDDTIDALIATLTEKTAANLLVEREEKISAS